MTTHSDRPGFDVLDLFSGIGGFSLGLERAGMKTVAFCEQDGYARRVLRKHWPDVWLYEDVRTLTAKRLKKDGLAPNVICGGFPCQDISAAGKGAGIDGPRSGLWSEMFRLVEEIKPLWVVAENVPALRGRGADRVLADLEGAGYSTWPVVVGAVHVGANHRRERVWIVAHSVRRYAGQPLGRSPDQRERPIGPQDGKRIRNQPERCGEALADAGCESVAKASDRRAESGGERDNLGHQPAAIGRWQAEPAVGRLVDGVPARMDRLRCLGNAVVPLIPELIGRAILEYHEAVPA